MELALTQQQEERLTELAHHRGKNVGDLLVETANSLLRTEEERWKDVEYALAQADRGELLDEEEMHERFLKMIGR